MKRYASVLIACSIAMLASACASNGGMRDTERLALYQSHAGAPLRDIRYSNPIGWESVDDQHLLLTMTPRNVYLVKLSGPCLDYNGGNVVIGISSQAGRVSTGFDRVTIADPRLSCRIEEIREVDMVAFRKARDSAGSS